MFDDALKVHFLSCPTGALCGFLSADMGEYSQLL